MERTTNEGVERVLRGRVPHCSFCGRLVEAKHVLLVREDDSGLDLLAVCDGCQQVYERVEALSVQIALDAIADRQGFQMPVSSSKSRTS